MRPNTNANIKTKDVTYEDGTRYIHYFAKSHEATKLREDNEWVLYKTIFLGVEKMPEVRAFSIPEEL